MRLARGVMRPARLISFRDRCPQRKKSQSLANGHDRSLDSLALPLTDEVGSAIQDHLRKLPRYGLHRQVFLRLKAPGGPLKTTAVIGAFQGWSARSGLEIPFKGVHCIRHSYALHLLRQGVPLKTIGDVLGHRSPKSTAVYLRLATEDLRTVALPVPAPIDVRQEER